MRSGAVGAVIVIISLCAVRVRASEGGRIGYSGKQNVICNACHSGGTRPRVRFEGPTEVASGATATFRFVLTSEEPPLQDLAGFNVAASAGTLRAVAGQKERLSMGELTHSDPKAIDGNDESAWQFDWTAPAQPGQQTLYGAGNSVNGNGNPTGDRAAATTWTIEVIDAVTSPTPSATNTPPESSPTPTASPSASPTDTPTPTVSASSTVAASPSVTVTETATATPTSSESVTATPTVEPSTASPSATATLTAFCDGDCDGDQRVSVAELVSGVSIALNRAPLANCAVLDRNGDGRVSVAELVSAVRQALVGC